MMVGAVN